MITLMSLAFAASAEPLPAMNWDWDSPQRFYVETEVRLPQLMRFNAEFNRSTRVMGYQVRTVLHCQGTEKESARKRLVQCDIDDISLTAGALPGDSGRVQLVIEEFDEVLTGSQLMLMVRTDGRIADVSLRGPKAGNLRTRARNETMRLVMRHIAAGLEVSLPKRAGDPVWLSNSALLCTLPTTVGTAGPVEAVHKGEKTRQGVDIVTNARGLMVPGDDGNRYTCEYSAHTVFGAGGPTERQWTMLGEPTPSSPIAIGSAGYPYTQRGSMRRLEAGEVVDVGTTEEVPVPGAPTAIQQGVE